MSVYRFFGTSGHILVSQWHFGRPCDVFLALWVTLGLRFVILGAPLWPPGVHFLTLGKHLGGFLWVWSDFLDSGQARENHLSDPGSLSGKRYEKRSQMDLQMDLQMRRFSLLFRYLYYFEGVMAGAPRTPVSGYFSCSVFWDSGKRNMELTTVFTVPNAHHICGSRDSISEFVVP